MVNTLNGEAVRADFETVSGFFKAWLIAEANESGLSGEAKIHPPQC